VQKDLPQNKGFTTTDKSEKIYLRQETKDLLPQTRDKGSTSVKRGSIYFRKKTKYLPQTRD